jgi:hypothetical protein
MALTGQFYFKADFALTKSTGLPRELRLPLTGEYTNNVADGTTDNKADRIYFKKLTLAATPTDLDLQSLIDVNGDAVSFAEIIGGYVENTDTANPLTIGGTGAITNAWTSWLSNPGTIKVRPAASATSPSIQPIGPTGDDPGFAVSGTNKVLRLDPGANTIVINIMLVGRSA